MRRITLMLLMGLLALSSAITGGTSASFTADVSSTASTFSAGTLVISTTPATALFTVGNLAPGDSVSGDLVVANTTPGSVPFRYAMTAAATNPDGKALMAALRLRVQAGTCAAPAGILYDGPFYDGSLPAMRVLGDPASGAQPGDRSLASGASEALCLVVSLPAGATNVLQAASTSASFTLDAEQA